MLSAPFPLLSTERDFGRVMALEEDTMVLDFLGGRGLVVETVFLFVDAGLDDSAKVEVGVDSKPEVSFAIIDFLGGIGATSLAATFT